MDHAHYVVGTAGHVDHGKTTLVRHLTGIDTDRLPEERQRGISIDLGFAPFTLPSGRVVSLVDVPGHERFIRNMVAGASGLDLVLLVVAADEGVMPQTREHLSILELLGVRRGLTVITKADLVDEEWLCLVREDLGRELRGTFLTAAPILTVSPVTGQGIPELLTALEAVLAETPRRSAEGFARLPIDRVFTVAGFGTVVTGTLWSGRIRPEDHLELWPKGKNVRVRSVEVHGQRVSEALAGARTALNLVGVEKSEVQRGDVLAGPGGLKPTRSVAATLELLAGMPPLKSGFRAHFHSGAKESLAQIILLDREELAPGERAPARLRFAEPLVVGFEDRYILRALSPLVTIGGGAILDPAGRARRGRVEDLSELRLRDEGQTEELAGRLIARLGPLERGRFLSLLGRPEEEAEAVLAKLLSVGEAVEREGFLYAIAAAEDWRGQTTEFLDRYHRENPRRAGARREELRQRLFPRWEARLYNTLLIHWQKQGHIAVRGERLARADFAVRLSPAEESWRVAIRKSYSQGGLSPPEPEELRRTLGIPPEIFEDLLALLTESGELVRVGRELYLERGVYTDTVSRVREFLRARVKATVAEIRDLLGTTRKYAVPLLEYLDEQRITRRSGEERSLGSEAGEGDGFGQTI